MLCLSEDHLFCPGVASLCKDASTSELARCTQAVCVPQWQCALVAEPSCCGWRLACIFGQSGHWRVNWGFSVQLLSPLFGGGFFYWLMTLRGLGIKRRAKPSCVFPQLIGVYFGAHGVPLFGTMMDCLIGPVRALSHFLLSS